MGNPDEILGVRGVMQHLGADFGIEWPGNSNALHLIRPDITLPRGICRSLTQRM